MVLTFRSSIPEERVIVERNANGDKRVARAVQMEHNPKMWRLSGEHPSGRTIPGSFAGDGNTVVLALGQMLMDSANDYKQEAARGHRPAPMLRDTNVSVNDLDQGLVLGPSKWSR